MEIEILSKNENKLLHRTEYIARLSHLKEKTPQRIESKDKLAAVVNSDKDRTIVVNIDSDFGRSMSDVEFRVYESPELMKKIELRYLLKRNGFISEEG